MSTNPSVSNVGEFQPDNESISAYLERVSLFFEVNGIEAGKKVAWLLNMIGAKNYSLVRILVAPDEPKSKTLEQLTAVLKQHYEPKRLVIARRFYFHRRDQDTNESTAEYVAELRKLASPCEFGDYLNEALRDRFVCGLRSESTQKRLLSEVDLTLTKAVSIAQSMEAAESEAHTLRSEKMAVHKLESEKSSRTIVTLPPKKACHRCGKNNHSADNCFYKEAICNKCKKKGHLAKVCRSAYPHSGQQSQEKPVRRTQWVERSPTPDDELPLHCLGSHSSKPIIAEVELNGTLVSMEVDTGAAVSLMSQAVQERLFSQATLQATTTNLRTYTGEAMEVIGKLPVTVTYANQSKALTLYIVPGNGPTLLGREWLQHIKLDWKSIAMVSKDPLQQLLDKHASIFEDTLGTIKDYTATLKVKEPALPKFYRPRPVPFAVREAVGSELDRLEKLGILEKVEHSQWAAPIVPVPKSNGAVISQVGLNGDEQPVAYASRTLSTPEKNYYQIEKEALSLIFGLRKFHQYLYARNFTIVTDHKPLLAILGPKKNIPALAAARMQRWALLLSAYNYNLEYRPTQAHGNADGLSRLPVAQVSAGQPSQSSSESSIYNVCQVEYLPVTVMQLQRTTQYDPVLSKVLHYTKYGWPAHLTPSNKDLKPFWDRRLELTTEGQCLLWGTRVVIPNKLYSTVLDELHTGHPGIVCMKAIARSYVWWPGLDKAIENQVKSCKPCQTVKHSPPKAPLHPWVWPMNPWERIHVDFAGPFLHKMFMIVMDAHSKWPEVIEMPETTSGTTIKELRKLFASYGVPRQVATDNGPQFTSNEFSVFMKSNGVKHIKCSPYHPSSNGAAERFVQTFKRSIKAAEQQGKSVSQRICEFLLSYRNTPHVTTKETPSMLFLKRQLRTRLDLLCPDIQATVHDTQDQQNIAILIPNNDTFLSEHQLWLRTLRQILNVALVRLLLVWLH